jgi:hypothetical protein
MRHLGKSSEEVKKYCVGWTLLFWYQRAQIVNISTLLFLKPYLVHEIAQSDSTNFVCGLLSSTQRAMQDLKIFHQ